MCRTSRKSRMISRRTDKETCVTWVSAALTKADSPGLAGRVLEKARRRKVGYGRRRRPGKRRGVRQGRRYVAQLEATAPPDWPASVSAPNPRAAYKRPRPLPPRISPHLPSFIRTSLHPSNWPSKPYQNFSGHCIPSKHVDTSHLTPLTPSRHGLPLPRVLSLPGLPVPLPGLTPVTDWACKHGGSTPRTQLLRRLHPAARAKSTHVRDRCRRGCNHLAHLPVMTTLPSTTPGE
jgi:hypothetical protein